MGNACLKTQSRFLLNGRLSNKVSNCNTSKQIGTNVDSSLEISHNHSADQQKEMNTAHEKPLLKKVIPSKIKSYKPFLSTSWPGSILNWSKEDIDKFSSCFTPHHFKNGEEVRG